MTAPVKNAPKTRGRPFGRGNDGRPRGARNKRTVLVEALMADDAERLARKTIKLALSGDTAALRLCLDRISPVRKGRPITFTLPTVTDAASLMAAHAALLQAVAAGELTPDEAEPVSAMLTAHLKTIETVDHAARLDVLERKAGLRK